MKINGYALDKEQLKPIIENKPYSLIIAGAGSGKTRNLNTFKTKKSHKPR